MTGAAGGKEESTPKPPDLRGDRRSRTEHDAHDAPVVIPEFSAARPGRRRRWPWVVGALLLVLIVIVLRARSGEQTGNEAAASKAQARNRPIPVVAAKARTGDLGVYINGLGTVTAINTVTVRSRVDGELLRVTFQEGQLVKQNELLAQIDPRPFEVQLTQAEGQQAKDEAALKNAQLDLERYRALMEQDAIPRQQLDTQAATVRQFEASLKTDQGQIESAKLNLTYSRIVAPITGRVGLRLVDAGNMVHATDPNGLLVITQIQPIAVVFNIPADRLPPVLDKLRAGTKLSVEAYDRELKTKLATGSVLAIDNQIDQTTGTVRLKAMFGNEDAHLFPNQFVNARLLVDTLHGAVIVPSAAIQRSPQSSYVYVIQPDSTVAMKTVDVQLTEGDDVALKSGVASGESVVIDGVDKLQPGSKVAASPAGTGGARKAAP